MNERSPILSISMLISGQEDMPKSVESLMPFKKALHCEIILVDTGCGKEQRALAEQYADKVIDFAWCDDFAAARNAGLKEARGEWFLFLDDDEWFDDTEEIISFFQSGEHQRYNSASYAVRNYSNFRGTMYEDSYPSRMVRLEPGTRFVGKIHEYLEPFRQPKKIFSAFVHHYGYVYRDEEEKRKHAFRNIKPLLELRKKHPGDPRWMCQLAQEYFAIKEYENTVTVCEEGLKEWKAWRKKVVYAPSDVGALYAYVLVSMESMEDFGEEEKWLERALKDPMAKLKGMEPTMAFYCMAGARLYRNIGKYPLSTDYFRKYIEYYHVYRDDRRAVEEGAAAIVGGVFQEWILYGTILMCMESAIRVEDYEMAEHAFYLMNWQDGRLLRQERWEKAMLDACCSVTYHPLWGRILQTLVSREGGMEEMLGVFLETEDEYKQQNEEEKLLSLYRLVAELSYEHPYILRTKQIWEELTRVAARAEMRKLAETLKSTAKQQLEKGDRQTAEMILRQLQQYVPEDEEVSELLGRMGENG